MPTSTLIGDALADFEAFVLDGLPPEGAAAEAARVNDVEAAVLISRLTRDMPLHQRAQQVLADYSSRLTVATIDREVANCKSRTGRYSKLGFLSLGAEEMIADAVAESLQRPATKHDLFLIGERLNPWISELKLARKIGSKPLRQMSLKDN